MTYIWAACQRGDERGGQILRRKRWETDGRVGPFAKNITELKVIGTETTIDGAAGRLGL
jgi:hypothetical protein